MQNISTQWGKSCTFESSDSETDLRIMKSKVSSSYYLNVVTKRHLLKGTSMKDVFSSWHIPLKRITSRCDKQFPY